MGRTCVCGAETLDVDAKAEQFTRPRRRRRARGRHSSRSTARPARCSLGEVPVRRSLVVRYFEGEDGRRGDLVVAAVDRLMAARRRRTAGCGCAPTPTTPEDAARARRFGAEGIGLCRTEHMFLGERRAAGRAADPGRGRGPRRRRRSTSCCRCSAHDFVEIFEAMDGLPVTIRLIDPPLHEFLPDFTELSVKVARGRGRRGEEHDKRLAAAATPCTGCTSRTRCSACAACASASSSPGLFEMQARAILEAAADRDRGAAATPSPEIMIPLVGGRRGAATWSGPRSTTSPARSQRERGRRTLDHPRRHDDRAAARRADRRRRSPRRPTSSPSAPTT